MNIAKSEGWIDKAGSKWKTIPEQMKAYRAATFWTRLYAPEISMGIRPQDEIEDIGYEDVSHSGKSQAITSDVLKGILPHEAEVITETTDQPEPTKSAAETSNTDFMNQQADQQKAEQVKKSKGKKQAEEAPSQEVIDMINKNEGGTLDLK